LTPALVKKGQQILIGLPERGFFCVWVAPGEAAQSGGAIRGPHKMVRAAVVIMEVKYEEGGETIY